VLLLEAFRRMLEPAVEVVGAVKDGAALVEQALELEPDLVVADVSMPRMNGLEAAPRLRGEPPRTRVGVLAVNADTPTRARGLGPGRLGLPAQVLDRDRAHGGDPGSARGPALPVAAARGRRSRGAAGGGLRRPAARAADAARARRAEAPGRRAVDEADRRR